MEKELTLSHPPSGAIGLMILLLVIPIAVFWLLTFSSTPLLSSGKIMLIVVLAPIVFLHVLGLLSKKFVFRPEVVRVRSWFQWREVPLPPTVWVVPAGQRDFSLVEPGNGEPIVEIPNFSGGKRDREAVEDFYRRHGRLADFSADQLQPSGGGISLFTRRKQRGIDLDLDWMTPPSDMHDPAIWDRYWQNQISSGLNPAIFDLFADDENLVRALSSQGMKTILCAGSGISAEPRALAEAGFVVTAMDLSPQVLAIAQDRNGNNPEESYPFYPPALRKPGGSVTYISGDLLDPAICPGPYDVVIERRTLQVFAARERTAALDALIARLQPEGILLSHCHDGGWRPPAEPYHATRGMFFKRGFSLWSGQGPKPEGRSAWVVTSTG